MKQKIRALIVDDEKLGRDRVRASLSADPEIEIIDECTNGGDAIAAINEKNPHLVFLDVRMPQTDGFDVLKAIDKEKMPLVIFVTAYNKYAVRAFDVHAVDYLLKPYDDSRFQEAVKKAKRDLQTKEGDEITARTLALLEELKNNRRYLERLPIKIDECVRFIKAAQIDWIEAEDKFVRLHVGTASYLIHEAISNLEAQLDPDQFPRIHRKYIINIDRITQLEPLFHHEYQVALRDGTKLKVSRHGLASLERILRRKL